MADMHEGDPEGVGPPRRPARVVGVPAAVRSGKEAISTELALTIFRQMVRTSTS